MEQHISPFQTNRGGPGQSSGSLLRFWILFLGFVVLLVGFQFPAEAQLVEQKIFEYDRFFADAENIMAAKPKLLPQFMYGLVDLKGNKKRAKAKIYQEIFACNIGLQTSGCQIARMQRIKRERQIQNSFTIPVRFTSVTSKRIKWGRHLVTFTWRPKLIEVEHWSMDQFREYFNLAEDSAYYQFKEDLKNVVFATQFEQKFQVLMTPQEARVFVTLYQNPPTDNKDKITFKISRISTKVEGPVARIKLHLKAKKVIANHRAFRL